MRLRDKLKNGAVSNKSIKFDVLADMSFWTSDFWKVDIPARPSGWDSFAKFSF